MKCRLVIFSVISIPVFTNPAKIEQFFLTLIYIANFLTQEVKVLKLAPYDQHPQTRSEASLTNRIPSSTKVPEIFNFIKTIQGRTSPTSEVRFSRLASPDDSIADKWLVRLLR